MPGPPITPHRTPLRRISQGSLFALSRSNAFPDAPHGLGFIEPAMSELLDEAEALQANVEGLKQLSESLETFNEAFAGYLHMMSMNSLTVDWPQEPNEVSYELARRRAEAEALAASQPPSAEPDPSRMDQTTTATEGPGDMTHAPDSTAYTAEPSTHAPRVPTPKVKKRKPKLTAKEKKERAICIEKVVQTLPLEFRGNDPTLRRHIEMVITPLMEREGQGIRLHDLIVPPDLNQARVNKCLIVLVHSKIVQKDNTTGQVLYYWVGLPA
ncbi:hypothetical protein OE88DRAFT_1663160 [Heliocybe sulcata]|uniref:DASH complex subunit DAM1 n=1 Tax=Heliocybe sulcata TaxID=5364 RepID=A0A5C3MVM6_9AGAM|nr:hypothetical protein OE88DRAFT_1663160 [Heliocybe sulcata]